jgi:choline dehydrogenase-like flavoprotein
VEKDASPAHIELGEMNSVFGTEVFERRTEPYQVIDSDVVENADVCIIGSGAAGAVLATRIAESGRSVVILESGGYYDGESMNQREQDMIPLLWKNGGANFTSDLKIPIAQGSCLGGSTVINDAVCFRIPRIVIKQWQKMGVSISEEEWNAANDEVSKRINITKVTESELNANAKKLREACTVMKTETGPITKHWANERNCGPSITDPALKSCVKCGFCHLGCHYDTKQSMLVTYIHDGIHKTKSYKAYCNCRAEKITHRNGVADGVDGVFVDETGNEKFRIRVNAKLVIVSAGAIASSNILQKSMIGGPNVGKGFALHPAPFVIGCFKEDIHGNRGIPMSYTCHEFGVTNGIESGGFLIESIFLPVFQMALAIPTFGTQHAQIMADYANFAMAGVMVRDESTGTITKTYGSKPKIDYTISKKTIDDIARGMEILARMWFSTGARYVLTSHSDYPILQSSNQIEMLANAIRKNPDGLRVGSAHPQGGNRMGDDPHTCVVDSSCRVHDCKNIYVCDASVFPTALGVNPQLTVMALAAITAKRIIDNWNFQEQTASLGTTCNASQPEFCPTCRLDEMFHITSHREDLFGHLENSEGDRIIPNVNWKFDKNTMKIYNNVYWKGFYGRDLDLMTTSIRTFGGFYKRFRRRDKNSFDGITKPFDVPVFAKSKATEKDVPGYGKVIHLEYSDFPYSQAYDLLKIVDEHHILGKAFTGSFGKGRELFSFSMCKTYGIDFMTEDDLDALFYSDEYSRKPDDHEMVGRWEGMLVSDSAITPRTQVFEFAYDGSGKLDMSYNFGNLILGRSDVKSNHTIFRFDDFTPLHDELRMVTPDFAVGKWVTEWSREKTSEERVRELRRLIATNASFDAISDAVYNIFHSHLGQIPKEVGVSFLNVENDKQKGVRIGLGYILKRIA